MVGVEMQKRIGFSQKLRKLWVKTLYVLYHFAPTINGGLSQTLESSNPAFGLKGLFSF